MISPNRLTNGICTIAASFAMALLAPPALAEGTWQIKAPMPMAIKGGVAGVIDGKLYAVGGNDANLQSKNESYDLATNSWSYKTPSATLRSNAAGGVIGSKLYVAGGAINFDPRIGTTNLLEAYDAATNTWSALKPMLTARSGAAGGVIDGKLYVVGGTAACPPCVPQYGTLEVYDPATDSWSTKQPMPTPREGATASVIGGKLYVAGGYSRSLNAVTNILEVYDPATDSWTTAAPLPTARQWLASVALNGKLHVVGGNTISGTVLATHEVYDPAANVWATETPMPTARLFLQAGVVGTTLYVVGGGGATALVTANEAFTVCGDALLCVGIDIKPGSDVNPINPDSQGKIAVAILSTATFDATHVDTSTLHFGTATVVSASVEDVNGDGRPDIVLHFNTTDVGIACGDTSATLIGFTLDGQSIQGSDLIRTVGCK